MRFLLFYNGGGKGYEYNLNQQGEKKEQQWVEQNQCIVMLSEN